MALLFLLMNFLIDALLSAYQCSSGWGMPIASLNSDIEVPTSTTMRNGEGGAYNNFQARPEPLGCSERASVLIHSLSGQ